jgi:hypothetical protein
MKLKQEFNPSPSQVRDQVRIEIHSVFQIALMRLSRYYNLNYELISKLGLCFFLFV